MRAVVQRVASASVSVDGREISSIGSGLLVLLGIGKDDGPGAARKIAARLCALRVFSDSEGKMNLSVRDVGGAVLVVSQFTLYGDTRKGNRPSFVSAATPEEAEKLVEMVSSEIEAQGVEARLGQFRAHMEVALVNDGPVTIILET